MFLFEWWSHREERQLHSGGSWADLKPGDRKLLPSFPLGTVAQKLEASTVAFPGQSRKQERKYSRQDINRLPYWKPVPQAEP